MSVLASCADSFDWPAAATLIAFFVFAAVLCWALLR